MTRARQFEGTRDGEPVRVVVWRNGTVGHTDREGHAKFESDKKTGAAVVAAMEAFAAERLAEGFVEIDPEPPRVLPELDAAELARHLANLPVGGDDDAPYLVFADWLQTKGHPWGELIGLQHRLASAKPKQRPQLETAIDELLADHGTALVGAAIGDPESTFAWHHGFVRAAMIGCEPDAEAIRAVLADLVARPIASQLESIVFKPLAAELDTVRDWDDTETNLRDPWTDLDALGTLMPARVTHVGFGSWPAPAAAAYVRMPSFTAISRALPKLTELELTGWVNADPGVLELPELRKLAVRCGDANAAVLEAITSSKLPQLARLSVWLGGTANCVLDEIMGNDLDYDEGSGTYPDTFDAGELDGLTAHTIDGNINADELATFLAALPASVKHLGLQSAVLDDDLIRAIAASPRVKKLRSLDLSGGSLDSPKALVSAKEALAHLPLDLERNFLTPASVTKIKAALPKAKLGDQRKPLRGSAKEPELFTRYIAVME